MAPYPLKIKYRKSGLFEYLAEGISRRIDARGVRQVFGDGSLLAEAAGVYLPGDSSAGTGRIASAGTGSAGDAAGRGEHRAVVDRPFEQRQPVCGAGELGFVGV